MALGSWLALSWPSPFSLFKTPYLAVPPTMGWVFILSRQSPIDLLISKTELDNSSLKFSPLVIPGGVPHWQLKLTSTVAHTCFLLIPVDPLSASSLVYVLDGWPVPWIKVLLVLSQGEVYQEEWEFWEQWTVIPRSSSLPHLLYVKFSSKCWFL